MHSMTLAEFIETDSDEAVYIVDGPVPMVGTGDFDEAARWKCAVDRYRDVTGVTVCGFATAPDPSGAYSREMNRRWANSALSGDIRPNGEIR